MITLLMISEWELLQKDLLLDTEEITKDYEQTIQLIEAIKKILRD